MVVETRPLTPVPPPPEAVDVPPGPPPPVIVVVVPPRVPVTTPVLTPRKICPDRVRRMSVSAMSRLMRAMAMSKLFSSASRTASERLR